jgi:prepilin-type N-terminal cleavage/methylation domain-containing protein
MNKNEQGFSLIELAIAMAIMVSLGAIGFSTLSNAGTSIIAKQQAAEQAEADAFQAQIDAYTN